MADRSQSLPDAARIEALRKQVEHLKNAVADVKRYGASEVLSDGPEGFQTHDTAGGWLLRIAGDTVPMIEQFIRSETRNTTNAAAQSPDSARDYCQASQFAANSQPTEEK